MSGAFNAVKNAIVSTLGYGTPEGDYIRFLGSMNKRGNVTEYRALPATAASSALPAQSPPAEDFLSYPPTNPPPTTLTDDERQILQRLREEKQRSTIHPSRDLPLTRLTPTRRDMYPQIINPIPGSSEVHPMGRPSLPPLNPEISLEIPKSHPPLTESVTLRLSKRRTSNLTRML